MKKRPVGLILILAALVPLLAHIILLTIHILKDNHQPFGIFDLAVFITVLIYLSSVILFLNRREYFIRLMLVTYSLLFAAIFAEFLLRSLCISPVDLPFIPMHYVSYRTNDIMPGIGGKIEFSVNQYGLRGPEVNLDNVEIKILVIGGSAAECVDVTDKLSWPWRLQDGLSERLKKNVFVGNAGKGGHFTLNHIYMLQNYKWAPQFDWIIVLCGINDAGRLLRHDYKKRAEEVPDTTFDTIAEKHKIYYRRSIFFLICKSIVLKYFSYETMFQDPEGVWLTKKRRIREKALKNHAINRLPSGLDEAIRLYKDNLRSIINISRERNQHILMLTQPTLWRKGLPPDHQKLLWEYVNLHEAYTPEILEQIMKAYNLAMIDVCRQEGIQCLDLASMFSEDISIFFDDAHFNISGCEAVAAILTEEMAKWYKKNIK